MSNRRKQPGRKANRTGRSRSDPFVYLPHYMLNSAAWHALSPRAVKLYIAMVHRYNGRNNGQISCSVREAAAILQCVKGTASKAFAELQQKGLIVVATPGSFHWKQGRATEWRLTQEQCGNDRATKDYMHWSPEAVHNNVTRS